jgi:hypothetical protein
MIRLLAPLESLPEVEILDVQLSATIAGQSSVGNDYGDALEIFAELYIVPRSGNRLVIPFHRCRVEFEVPGVLLLEASWLKLDPAIGGFRGAGTVYPGSLTIQSTAHEVVVDGPA